MRKYFEYVLATMLAVGILIGFGLFVGFFLFGHSEAADKDEGCSLGKIQEMSRFPTHPLSS